jgi:hypothetical protein
MQVSLTLLIPVHTQTTKIDQSQNPFRSAVVIKEKKTQQLYGLIDGVKSVEELTSLMHINGDEAVEMLKSLLAQRYIKLRDEKGNSVEI